MDSYVNPPEIDAYCEAHSTPPPDRMRALAEETRASLRDPAMLTGTVEGRFLEMLVWVSNAHNVLELGTYSGYSSLSMAAALPPGGRIVSCELDPEHIAFARRHIAASPYADRIDILEGPGLESIERLDGPFELIFIDADKSNYAAYYEAALPLLAARGLIVIDNTLWSGRVVPEAGEPEDDTTTVMRELNDRIVADDRVVCVQLPVRDGVTLVRRA